MAHHHEEPRLFSAATAVAFLTKAEDENRGETDGIVIHGENMSRISYVSTER